MVQRRRRLIADPHDYVRVVPAPTASQRAACKWQPPPPPDILALSSSTSSSSSEPEYISDEEQPTSFWPAQVRERKKRGRTLRLVGLADLDEVQRQADLRSLKEDGRLAARFVDRTSLNYLTQEERAYQEAERDAFVALAPPSLTSAVDYFELDEDSTIIPPPFRGRVPSSSIPNKVPLHLIKNRRKVSPPEKQTDGTDTPTFPEIPKDQQIRKYNIFGSERTERLRTRSEHQQKVWLQKAQRQVADAPMWPADDFRLPPTGLTFPRGTDYRKVARAIEERIPRRPLAEDFKLYGTLMERSVNSLLGQGGTNPATLVSLRSQFLPPVTLHPLVEKMMPDLVDKARNRRWLELQTFRTVKERPGQTLRNVPLSHLSKEEAKQWTALGLFPVVYEEAVDVPRIDTDDVLNILYPLEKPLKSEEEDLLRYKERLETAKQVKGADKLTSAVNAKKEEIKVGGYYLRKR